MKNKMQDLRNHLFATLEALQDEENPMELARAKVISAVAQTLINSAKTEVDFIRQIGLVKPQSEFFAITDVAAIESDPDQKIVRN